MNYGHFLAIKMREWIKLILDFNFFLNLQHKNFNTISQNGFLLWRIGARVHIIKSDPSEYLIVLDRNNIKYWDFIRLETIECKLKCYCQVLGTTCHVREVETLELFLTL